MLNLELTLDPKDERDQKLLKRLAHVIGDIYGSGDSNKNVPQPQSPNNKDRDDLELVLSRPFSRLLKSAAKHYGPDEEFTFVELAQKTDRDLQTILSWNRNFAQFCRNRSIRRNQLFVPHEGSPKRFALPKWVHGTVKQIQNATPDN